MGQAEMLQFCSLADKPQASRVCQPVVHEAPLPAGLNETRLTERHQVLGKVSLAVTEGCFQVADAGFLITDGQQDLEPCRLGDGQQELRKGIQR